MEKEYTINQVILFLLVGFFNGVFLGVLLTCWLLAKQGGL